jgi:subtilisin family serine protease
MNAVGGKPIYRLPPYTLGPVAYLASDLDDIVDWGLKAHGIEQEWQDTRGEGVVVGVADTGRPRHSDLDNNLVASKNFSTSFTDEDLQGHSTHVCGTIAAEDNGKGVVGVAPKAKIVTAKVLGDDNSGSNESVADGIYWLIEQKVDIINMSLGGPYDELIEDACKKAHDAGILLICAAGNYGHVPGTNTVNYPARLDIAAAIGSYNKDGTLSEYSSWGKEVLVAFPGENILSTWPNETYRRISGTSMAAPFAAGVAALKKASIKKIVAEGKVPARPVRNTFQLIDNFKRCAADKGPEGFDKGWGWGIVDVSKFLENAGLQPLQAPETNTEKKISLIPGLLEAYVGTHVNGKTGVFIYIP